LQASARSQLIEGDPSGKTFVANPDVLCG